MDEARLWALMAGVDVCVNLRHPTMGETSGSAIRALSLGKPLVVSDVGWFRELPDDVALKVPIDERRGATRSTAALELLVTRDGRARGDGRGRVRARARASTISSGSPSSTRRRSSRPRAADAVGDAVLREVSEAAADVGISPDTAEAGEIAARLAEVELGG